MRAPAAYLNKPELQAKGMSHGLYGGELGSPSFSIKPLVHGLPVNTAKFLDFVVREPRLLYGGTQDVDYRVFVLEVI